MARTYTGPASKDTVKGGKKFPLKYVGSDHNIDLTMTNGTAKARGIIMRIKGAAGQWNRGGFTPATEKSVKGQKPSSVAK